jgi:hypothetical protein
LPVAVDGSLSLGFIRFYRDMEADQQQNGEAYVPSGKVNGQLLRMPGAVKVMKRQS